MKKRILTISIISVFIVLAIFALGACGDECQHSWVEKQVLTPADCENDGTIEMVCESCGATQNETTNATGHNYVAEWEWNGVESAKLILTCKNDSKHVAVVDATISSNVTAPTCTKDGKTVYTATATNGGKEYKDTIEVTVASLGTHTYENGKCTFCQEGDPSCLHLDSAYELVNLKEKGVCGGLFSIKKCNDCGYSSIVSNESFLTCEDLLACEALVVVNAWTDELTGTDYVVKICQECGLKAEERSFISGCVRYSGFKLTLNGEVIFDAEYEKENHYNASTTYSLDDCNDSIVQLRVCGRCQEILEIENISSDCLNNAIPTVKKVTDANGIEHTIEHRLCVDCGYSLWTETWTEVSGCITTDYTTTKIFSNGSNMIDVDFTSFDIANTHEIETKYEFINENDCSNGIAEIKTCTKCGLADFEISYEHNKFTDVELVHDFTSDNTCGDAKVYKETCKCGQLEIYDFISGDCYFNHDNEKTVKDKDGTIHVLYYFSCAHCGLEYIRDKYDLQNGCETQEMRKYSFYFDDDDDSETPSVLLKEFLGYYEKYETHDYEISYEMHGDSCEDGVTVSYKCTSCGEAVNEEEIYWHYLVNIEEYELSKDGACGGAYLTMSCACGLIEEFDFVDDGYCDETVTTEVDTENGLWIDTIYTCEDCGRVRKIREYAIINEETCLVTEKEKYTIKVGDKETVIYDVVTDEYYDHDTLVDELVVDKENNRLAIESVCPNCDVAVKTIDYYTVAVGMDDAYEFKFTPSKSGTYVIASHADQDTKVFLYGPNGEYLGQSDDDGDGNNFRLAHAMNAGKTYTYKIEFYSSDDSGDIPFSIMEYVYDCDGIHMEVPKTYELEGDCQEYSVVQCDICKSIISIEQKHILASIDENNVLSVKEACACGEYKYEGEELPTAVKLYYAEIETADAIYEFEFTPDKTATYTIYSLSVFDVEVALLDSEDVQLAYNDDGSYDTNFIISAELEQGKTYTYQISFHSSTEIGTIPFTIIEETENYSCNDDAYGETITVYTTDGSAVVICKECGEIAYIENTNE